MNTDTAHGAPLEPEAHFVFTAEDPVIQRARKRRQQALMLIGLASLGWDATTHPPRVTVGFEPKARPCRLPGCDQFTTHRGGYCCAAHKHEHKRRSLSPQTSS